MKTRTSQWLFMLVAGATLTFNACSCPGAVGADCQSGADCSPTLTCLDTKTCATKCATDANCAATEKCSASHGCVPKTGCGADGDCNSGQACTSEGECAQSCQGMGSCGSTAVCLQSGTCTSKCTGAADCPGGKCSTVGGCVPMGGCGAKEDCAANQLCDSLGRCASDCRTAGGCNPGSTCGTDGQCLPDNPDGGATTCGGELFQAAKVNSNMYIAFDKSGSMNDPIAAGGMSKWVIATTAIKQVTAQYESQIQFGLGLFPAGGGTSQRCLAAPTSVTVGDLRAMPIATALDGAAPGGNTPIGAVLQSAGNVPELVDATRANYVMLVTDGTETCNGNGVQAATDNLAMKGIKTFVIGFGGGVDATNLTDIAVAGGTPRAGMPKYYQADDAAGLLAAFNLIAQGALGCEYRLAAAPPDPSKVFVYVNGVLQNRDVTHANGWDYSPATLRITFYGGLCSLVATDATARVSIVYGCRDDTLTEVDRRDGGARLPNGSACTINADCANNLCSAGLCGLPVGGNCTTGNDCASSICTGGKCQPGIN
ncbi:MAG: vWA domain-containing protein [Archangium sp.]|nr:vWA domain-containing protein [Archangium sp.]